MEDTLPARVRFGVFELNLKTGELCSASGAGQGDNRVLLREQAFQVLRILVEYGGEIATREEIKKKLWPNDTVVEFDHCINVAIGTLRRALGDSADEPKYIETLARRGYRLMVPVEWVEAGDEPSSSEVSSSDEGKAARMQVSAAGLIGTKVSHYRVLEIIGGGGMGLVYQAEDLKLGRRVALKFLPDELASDSVALQRFEREARTASSLNHPNICTIYEVEEHEGQPFIVMELLEGETLRDRLAKAEMKAIPLDRLLDIAIGITDGLQVAHEKGIIHRDIKPANIFLTTQGQVKILDFGLAKLTVEAPGVSPDNADAGNPAVILSEERRDESKDPYHPDDLDKVGVPRLAAQTRGHSLGMTHGSDVPADPTLTRTGSAMGTTGYMSPEQIRGEKLDARTDLFSFGLVLYEMATGQRAFSGETAAVVHDAILNSSPISVRELNSSLPEKLTATIDKALQKDRDLRYQSAAVMRADLDRLQRGRQLVIPELPVSGRWRWFTAAALLLALLAGGWIYWRFRNTVKLTANDTIVLGDFTNTTSDPVLSDALNLALDTEFGQTPSVTLLSVAKKREIVKAMGLDGFTQITPELGREVCRRTNSKVLVEPSASDAGDHYRIVLKALDCQNDRVLADIAVEAERRSDLVKMVGVGGFQLRQKLGEPKASLKNFNVPVEMLQSASPEAMQAMVQTKTISNTKGDREALSYAKRAVELDPQCARAYAMLGSLYTNLGEDALARQAAGKAYELRDRLGLNNRYRIAVEGTYYTMVTGELEKALQTDLQFAELFPNSAIGYANAGAVNIALGRFERAIPQLEEAIRLYPDGVFPYWNLVKTHLALNRLEEAKSVLERATARKLDADELRDSRYGLGFLQGDHATMQEQVKWAVGKPEGEIMLLEEEANTAAYYGQFVRARAVTQQAMTSTSAGRGAENVAKVEVRQACREAEVGNASLARKATAEALKLKLPQSARALAALVLARIGNTAHASKMADELNQEFPLDTFVQHYWLPSIRAAVALENNNPQEAIRALAPAVAYELAFDVVPTMQPVYLSGLAYLKAGQGQEAKLEFQKILNHPGVVLNYVTGALAHLQFARAQVMMGDRAAARKSYQDFLTLWKDADPDIPIYKQAKAEYAKLR